MLTSKSPMAEVANDDQELKSNLLRIALVCFL